MNPVAGPVQHGGDRSRRQDLAHDRAPVNVVPRPRLQNREVNNLTVTPGSPSVSDCLRRSCNPYATAIAVTRRLCVADGGTSPSPDTEQCRGSPDALCCAKPPRRGSFHHFQDPRAWIACHGSKSQPPRKRPMMMVGFSWLFIGLAFGLLAPRVIRKGPDSQLPV